jgi:hypothetical protein
MTGKVAGLQKLSVCSSISAIYSKGTEDKSPSGKSGLSFKLTRVVNLLENKDLQREF